MPSALVKKKFEAGKLHSGSKRGPIVTNPRQMRAIQISEARDEGYDIPMPPKKHKNLMEKGASRAMGKAMRGRRPKNLMEKEY